MPIAGQPAGGFQGSSGWGGGTPTGGSTPGGSTQTGTGKPIEEAQGGGYAQYQGVATRIPTGGGQTEYYYGGIWTSVPPSNIPGAVKSGESYIIPTTTPTGKPITYTSTERQVPVGREGQPIIPPATLQQSYRAEVFPVSYPGVSPALSAFTLGLTGWGETPAGKSFLPYATEITTTTTTYSPIGSSEMTPLFSPEAAMPKFSYWQKGKGKAEYSIIRSDIGTRQDIFAPINMPEFSPPGGILGLNLKSKQLAYERSPEGVLIAGGTGLFMSVASLGYFTLKVLPDTGIGLITDPAGTWKNIIGGAFITGGNIGVGLRNMVTEIKEGKITPAKAAYVGGAIIGGIAISEVASHLFTKAAKPFITTSTKEAQVGYLLSKSEADFGEIYHGVVMAGEKTTAKFMGFKVGAVESQAAGFYTGAVLAEPKAGINVLGITFGNIYRGKAAQPFFEAGAISGLAISEIPTYTPQGVIPYSITFGELGAEKIAATYSLTATGGAPVAAAGLMKELFKARTLLGEESIYQVVSSTGARDLSTGILRVVDMTEQPSAVSVSPGISRIVGAPAGGGAAYQLLGIRTDLIKMDIAQAASRLGLQVKGTAPLAVSQGAATIGKFAGLSVAGIAAVSQVSKVTIQEQSKVMPLNIATTMQSQVVKSASVTLPSMKQASVERQVQVQISKLVPATLPREAQIQIPSQVSKVVPTQTTRTMNITRVMEAMRTMEVTRTMQQTPAIPTAPTVWTPPKIPFIKFTPPSDFFGMKKIGRISPAGRRLTKYTPSIIVRGLGLRGITPNPKGVFSGIEIRYPISIQRKRKK